MIRLSVSAAGPPGSGKTRALSLIEKAIADKFKIIRYETCTETKLVLWAELKNEPQTNAS